MAGKIGERQRRNYQLISEIPETVAALKVTESLVALNGVIVVNYERADGLKFGSVSPTE